MFLLKSIAEKYPLVCVGANFCNAPAVQSFGGSQATSQKGTLDFALSPAIRNL